MTVNLHISLESFDDGDFDTRNDYYKSNDEFFNAMRAESERNSNLAYYVDSNIGNLVNKNTAHFYNREYVNKTKKSTYSANNVNLINENGNDETVDDFVADCIKDDVAVYTLSFNPDDIDPEFEEEYLSWVGEHNSINSMSDKYSSDWVWMNEPARIFNVEFKNKANEVKYAELANCKIVDLDKDNPYKCTVLAERVNLIDNI